MGELVYDSSTKVTFDDRILAHLEFVIINKLRRKESFAMSWREPQEAGAGRSTIWLDTSLPLRFHYDGTRTPKLDRNWLEHLATSAASSTGLIVTDEDNEPATGWTQDRPSR